MVFKVCFMNPKSSTEYLYGSFGWRYGHYDSPRHHLAQVFSISLKIHLNATRGIASVEPSKRAKSFKGQEVGSNLIKNYKNTLNPNNF